MKLSDNTSLPELPVWQARSFWVQLLLALSVILNTWGVDLFRVLADLGLGGTPDEVLASGERAIGAWQQLAPLVLGLWAWVERRAPNYRLVFWPKVNASILGLWLGVLVCIVMLGPGPATAQQQVPCKPYAEMAADLSQRFGEVPVWRGIMAPGPLLELLAAPDGSSWSAVVVQPSGGACLVAAGKAAMMAVPPSPAAQGEDG